MTLHQQTNARLHALLVELRDLLNAATSTGQQQSNNIPQVDDAALAASSAQPCNSQDPASRCGCQARSARCSAADPGKPLQVTCEQQQQRSKEQHSRPPDEQTQGQQDSMQSAASARPKPLSLLDMPQGEVFAGHSTCLSPLHVGPAGSNLQQCASSPKQAPEQQQQQQQQQSLQALRQMASPLMLSAKLYKPSIADVVMQLRAADQVQQTAASAAGSNPSADNDRAQNQVSTATAPTPSVSQAAALATELLCFSGRDRLSDAVVHAVQSSPAQQQDKVQQKQVQQQQQQQHEKHGVGVAWSIPAAYGVTQLGAASEDYNDIDLLANRVHSTIRSPSCSSNNLLQLAAPRSAGGGCHWLQIPGLKPTWRFIKALLWDVLLPTSTVIICWDMIMLTLIIYLAIVIPYAVAFSISFSDLSYPLAGFDLTINVMFMLDVWMNFHMAVVGSDGRLVTNRWKIAKKYLKGWFVFDVLSALPYEQLLSINNSVPSLLMLLKVTSIARLMKVLRLLRLLRLTRVMRLPHVVTTLEAVVGRVFLQLLRLGGSMLLLLHWAACVWYFMADIQNDNENWLYYNGLTDAQNDVKYISALYWSVTTIATVGYGDIVGHSVKEKIVAMIAMLIGASVFGYYMGAMTVMVSALNANSARMATKRQAVDNFLKHRKVPKLLADKVRSYYNYVVEREVQADEADIITGLSASLRTQVVLHLYQEALEKVPFFRGQHPQFITSVVTFLKLEYYSPGDIVARQGDVGAEMYFVGEGVLEVRLCEDEQGSPLARATYKRTQTKTALKAAAAKAAAAGPSSRRPSHVLSQSADGFARLRVNSQQSSSAVHGNSLSQTLHRGSFADRALSTCTSAALAAGVVVQRLFSSRHDPEYQPGLSGVGNISGGDAGGNANSAEIGASGQGGSGSGGAANCSCQPPQPHEYQLPYRSNKKVREKWTYVDELGDRPFRRIGYLRPGEYFGEYSCLLGEARTATVVASTYCELYSLSRGDLEEVLQQWPELAEEFEALVQMAADRKMAQSRACCPSSGALSKWTAFKAAYQQGLFSHQAACGTSQHPQPQGHGVAYKATEQQPQQQWGTGNAAAAAQIMPAAATVTAAAAAAGESSPDPTRNLHQPQPVKMSSGTHRVVHSLGDLCAPAPSLGRRMNLERNWSLGSAGGVAAAAAATAAAALAGDTADGNSSFAASGAAIACAAEDPVGLSVGTRDASAAAQHHSSCMCDSCSAPALAAADSEVAIAAEAVDVFSCSRSLVTSSTSLTAGHRSRQSCGSLDRQSTPLPVARNDSINSSGSGVVPEGPGLLSRSSGSLSRRSAGAAGSNNGVLPELRRTSWLPGRGSGLFAGGAGGYLFPYPVDRSGALMVQPAAAAAAVAYASAEDAQEVVANSDSSGRALSPSQNPSMQRHNNLLFEAGCRSATDEAH